MVDNVWTLPEPEKQPGFGKRFVGGFVAGFKRIPKAMSKSTNRDVEPTPMPVSFNDNIKLAPAALHYDKPPYQIHQPTNIPHERIHPPDSRHASSTTPSTQSSSMLAPASPPNLPAPRDPPPTLQPALPNPYAPPAELHTPAYIASPVEVHPRHASDYDAMSEPSSDLRQPSLNTRANQVGAFVKEFSHLPWINNRVATEYDPGQSHRAQEAQKHKKSGSWYTKRGQQRLDLLETPSHPKPMRTRDIFAEPHESKNPRSHSHSRSRPHRNHTAASDVVTAIRPSRTPASATSGGVVPTSPGASSHGRGSHAYSYSYYYSNPQPLYVYPAAVSPPRRPDANLNSGSQELQQALPVYMLAAPGPLVLPASPNHRSSGRHHRSNHHPKSTSPPNNSRNV
ncbi:hypothetical protein BXZ70DRAFT_678940 [Cristinia sonorae]|uniref:Uncharacterized protein n=1 Tax=Cristinia sonorae TaxID=1940300 RepID=A0A8K0UV32_9AGAR|nr:hypothetical protein BXZ70DRAFT_678940 [Cristinia sonorae]